MSTDGVTRIELLERLVEDQQKIIRQQRERIASLHRANGEVAMMWAEEKDGQTFQDVHHVHRWEKQPPEIQIKLEKNSRGRTWEIKASAPTVEECVAVLVEAELKLRAAVRDLDAVSSAPPDPAIDGSHEQGR